MLENGSYVRHVMAPNTRMGTISDGEIHNDKMRFIFHLDKRFNDAATFGEVYFYDYEIEECARPSDAVIAAMNKLAEYGGR